MVYAIREWLTSIGLSADQADWAMRAGGIAGVALLAVLANWVAKQVIVRVVRHVVKKTRTTWDDVLVEKRVFTRLSHLAPALAIWFLAPEAIGEGSEWAAIARQGAEIYMLAAALLVAAAFLDAVDEIYRRTSMALRLPIRPYIQVVKIALTVAVTIFALSIMLDKSPWVFLSGLGAISAVTLLIFKDSILGLVAGIQLSANDMVRPGDWIEMKKFGADGDVMEVSLTTVKVRNFDKTIVTIPTWALVTDAFRNWRGMEMSGGRRIKRAVAIDVTSIRFCTPQMIERFSRIQVLREYIETKQRELAEYNAKHGIDDGDLVNGRRMTNVGTFRAYLVEFLRRHPKVSQEMTFLVRQLPPSDKGLPIEIYVFSNDQRWARYEEIQADIFDHVFAALPEFELRPFQSPTGADISAAAAAAAAAAAGSAGAK